MSYEQLRLAVYLIGVPIIIYLCTRTVRRVREIRALDVRLRAEEQARLDAALRGDKPINPYADMAALYGISTDDADSKETKNLPQKLR